MVKTPLGIIALFVALIEAFLSYPVTQLQGLERMILVAFMVSFPFFIGMAFFYILWHRPTHLYNPGDIPTGLQDRFQSDAKIVAAQVKISELQEEKTILISRMSEAAAVVNPLYEGSKGVPSSGPNVVTGEDALNDLKSIESEVLNKIKTVKNPNEDTIRVIKTEVQRERNEGKRRIVARIEEEISRFQAWLEGIGFTNLPDTPKIIMEPADFYNIYYESSSNGIHVGRSLTDEYDGICHTYFAGYLERRWREFEGEQAAIVLGLCDYYACSFYNDPHFGKKLANLVGIKPGWLRNLGDVLTLTQKIRTKPHEMSLVWSGACWEFREIYGKRVVDSAICHTIDLLPKKLDMNNASKTLSEELIKVTSNNSKQDILKVFAKRGINVSLI